MVRHHPFLSCLLSAHSASAASAARSNALTLCLPTPSLNLPFTAPRTFRLEPAAPVRSAHANAVILPFLLQLVELKNGQTFNGHLVACDNFMNLTLREVYETSAVRFPQPRTSSHRRCTATSFTDVLTISFPCLLLLLMHAERRAVLEAKGMLYPRQHRKSSPLSPSSLTLLFPS